MSWPAYFSKVFWSLRGVKADKAGHWMAICPGHDDKVPSLSIMLTDDGKRLLFSCQAGCETPKILEAMGMTFKDLNAEAVAAAGCERKLAKVYDYKNKSGALVHQTLRYEPKSFMQRRPNPDYNPELPPDEKNKQWIYNLDGVNTVLYRLPDLEKALTENSERLILVLEGEADVDAAWAAGFVATTNPMGAGKWKPEYSAELADLNVAVVPDLDPGPRNVGMDHGIAVVESLKGKAKSVRIVYLPWPDQTKKVDFSSWLGTLGNLTPEQKREAFRKLITTPKQDPTEAPTSPHAAPDAPKTVTEPLTPPAQNVPLAGLLGRLSSEALTSCNGWKHPVSVDEAWGRLTLTLGRLQNAVAIQTGSGGVRNHAGRLAGELAGLLEFFK